VVDLKVRSESSAWIDGLVLTGRKTIPLPTYHARMATSLMKIMIAPGGSRLRHWAGEKLSPEQEIDGDNLLLRIGCTPGTGVQIVRQLATAELGSAASRAIR